MAGQQPGDAPREYRCGTLRYTTVTLTVLFAWLLWGDFCFTLMEAIVPSIVPLKLQKLGCSSTLLAMVTGTIPAILNLTVCPWISYKSDRHRSQRGRRIPYILYTLPFLSISLVMMGWSQEIGVLLATYIPFFKKIAPTTLAVGLISIFMIVFSFFNLFVNSVYWYLFNDVVPGHMLGRFTSLFRMVGTGAGSLYNWYIFPLGLTHTREIMTGAAVLYFVGFGLMCYFVKEGEYPPVERQEDAPATPVREFIRNIRTYARESFSVRFYWYFYLSQAFFAMACCGGIFGMFQQIELGLTLEQMGRMATINGLVSMGAMYFAAIYVDRWHPMRVLTYFSVVGVLGSFNGWIWLFMTLPSKMYFWMSLAGGMVGVFGGALNGACLLPALMRLMPKSRYGQLSSAYAMIRSVGAIVGSAIVGVVMDGTLLLCQHFGKSATFGYRWLFVWFGFFGACTTLCFALAYRKWQALGGDRGYQAPAPWEPSGFEVVSDDTPSVPCSPRWLMVALHLNTAAIALALLAAPVYLYATSRFGVIDLSFLQQGFSLELHRMPLAESCARCIYIPVMSLILLGWLRLVHAIRRDLRIVLGGRKPGLGIPHHGVLMVIGIQAILGFGVALIQYVWMIHLNLERELILVGLSAMIGAAGSAGGYYLLRLLEKGPDQQRRVAMPGIEGENK